MDKSYKVAFVICYLYPFLFICQCADARTFVLVIGKGLDDQHYFIISILSDMYGTKVKCGYLLHYKSKN